MKDVFILAIETSCDETSIAIVKNGSEVIALTILTQMDTHANYGGVIPEIASRMHTENITMVLDETLKKAHMSINDVDAIAVTYAPGLLGSLLVGIEFAKTLSYVYNKPLIAVNHTLGHIHSNSLNNQIDYPTLALIVSGGHTDLVILKGPLQIEFLGSSIDDSVGEVFDKVARVLNMPYPGGPNIEKKALDGQNSYQLPKPMNDDSYNFSFSGLKSSVINLVHNEKQRNHEIRINDLACSFQVTAFDELVRKVSLAFEKTNIKSFVLGGGVSASKYLRQELIKLCEKYHVNYHFPEKVYCTDNAAMIGSAAYFLYQEGKFVGYDLNASSTDSISKMCYK